MSKKHSESKYLTTPEKTAIAAQDFYDNEYDHTKTSAHINMPVDYKMSQAEKEAFVNPPFSEEEMKEMRIMHNQEKLLKNLKKESEINALAPRNFDTFAETRSMKQGKDTDMNVDGRQSPAPEMIRNPFESPENTPVKRRKTGGAKYTKKRKHAKKSRKTKRIKKGGVPPPTQRTWQRNEDNARNHPVLVELDSTIANDTHTNITRSFLKAYVNYDILLNVYLSTPTPEEGYNYAANYFIELESRVEDYLRTIESDKVRDFYETLSPAIDLDNPNSAANRNIRRLNEERFLIDERRVDRGLVYSEEIRRLQQIINDINRIVSAVGGKRSKKSKTRRRVKKRSNKKSRKPKKSRK